ncbi:MAG: SAM-dependent methyltransferase [Nostoc sp.]|uniref:class I SAM-dependent DNA methyltransferase n=1 Tax=Nostoc sp. TaxID=1180 RepID=UPI002FFA79E6
MNKLKCHIASLWQRFIFEMTFAIGSDPWKYTSHYQQAKYQQTLKLLPAIPIKLALEIGCAEGYLTSTLADRVELLIAADISQIALNRAALSCRSHGQENICFQRLDLNQDSLPRGCDLIVCSEVLYYISGQTALCAVAHKLADALVPGGYLLTTHAYRVDQEPDRHNLDWILPFGAKLIGETLENTYPLRLLKDIQTPYYRIQLFQHDCEMKSHNMPEILELSSSALPLPESGALDMFSLAFLYNQLQRLYKRHLQ